MKKARRLENGGPKAVQHIENKQDVICSDFQPASVALRQVERMQHLSEIEWQYAQAVAREEEIARNRPRPRRKALYPC
jgi:hypothetical protein